MATRRIFIIWTHTLFREAIRLSAAHPEFEWIGETNDFQQGVREVLASCPDTILIEDSGENQTREIVAMLQACAPDVRVIVMNLSNNRLSLYQYSEQYVAKPEDLISCMLRQNP